MLVAVEKPSRADAVDISLECSKSDMHIVLTVMNHPGRIVGNEHIDWWKGGQCTLHFRLLE